MSASSLLILIGALVVASSLIGIWLGWMTSVRGHGAWVLVVALLLSMATSSAILWLMVATGAIDVGGHSTLPTHDTEAR